MPNLQTQAYLRNYIQTNIENGIWKFALRITTNVLDWIITFGVGYEVDKITSDDKKDIWVFVEFFGVLTLCTWIWIIKFCCLNRFCISCWFRCCSKCVHRSQQEDISMGNPEDNGAEADNDTERVGRVEMILDKLHMILNRLGIISVGYELRKQLFKLKPLTFWDYFEISVITLFCIWILTIKYCVLNCGCIKFCCWGLKGCSCVRKRETVGIAIAENGTINAQGDDIEIRS